MTDSMPSQPAPLQRSVFQVHELVSTLKHGLEMNFPGVWVDGEISNFMAARSGHWYFTLKDDNAQIRCAFFRNRNLRAPRPKDGQRCLLRGRPSIYTARGELQLIVEELEDAGAGALHLAFERLKRKLAEEGLFADTRKLPLPAVPRCIGVITSEHGAALHDVLSTLARRNPLARVVLYPVPVQGAEAAKHIIAALQAAERRAECDVLLITRGGGSLEDLQAFNDEALARRIAALSIPSLSAIGHEIDFSISDFVASERAATPTAAAERLSPDLSQWHRRIAQARDRLLRSLLGPLQQQRRRLAELHGRLQIASPQRRLQDRAQWLDDLQQRLHGRMRQRLERERQALAGLQRGLTPARLDQMIDSRRQRWRNLDQRLQQTITRALQDRRLRLQHLHQRLQDLGPDDVLKRGYSITWHGDAVLHDHRLKAGEPLRIRIHSGELRAVVDPRAK